MTLLIGFRKPQRKSGSEHRRSHFGSLPGRNGLHCNHEENTKLKQLLADAILDNAALKDLLQQRLIVGMRGGPQQAVGVPPAPPCTLEWPLRVKRLVCRRGGTARALAKLERRCPRLLAHSSAYRDRFIVSDAAFYKWKSRYGGLEASEAKRLRAREARSEGSVRQTCESMDKHRVEGESVGRAGHLP